MAVPQSLTLPDTKSSPKNHQVGVRKRPAGCTGACGTRRRPIGR